MGTVSLYSRFSNTGKLIKLFVVMEFDHVYHFYSNYKKEHYWNTFLLESSLIIIIKIYIWGKYNYYCPKSLMRTHPKQLVILSEVFISVQLNKLFNWNCYCVTHLLHLSCMLWPFLFTFKLHRFTYNFLKCFKWNCSTCMRRLPFML